MNQPDSLEAYTVALLACDGRFLLLQRSASKTFAPLLWSGLGGHVELDEFTTLRASALREVWEESGIASEEIRDFTLRRVLLNNRSGAALRVILYFTGVIAQPVLPACPEGELHWMDPAEFENIDLIETNRQVFACLVEDLQADPQGFNPVKIGLGVFSAAGRIPGSYLGVNNPGAAATV